MFKLVSNTITREVLMPLIMFNVRSSSKKNENGTLEIFFVFYVLLNYLANSRQTKICTGGREYLISAIIRSHPVKMQIEIRSSLSVNISVNWFLSENKSKTEMWQTQNIKWKCVNRLLNWSKTAQLTRRRLLFLISMCREKLLLVFG